MKVKIFSGLQFISSDSYKEDFRKNSKEFMEKKAISRLVKVTTR